MRLKQIKLAGFKSFVEPTKIPFPAQMTAIVGPNGCGKSNVIDAVRWVMGESSAKNLRGDAMTDVIFNGSASRKPISVASVELLFDNSMQSLSGPYANFNEVAVKRQVSRDGQSNYFLNGHKCRRRDITDLFAGTGLGPRSYAIIEQGTISRLIESRPQELRVFIEEAAGISKYKDRRKETETRIRHSRENLERLNDISVELEQQLDKLKAQSHDAKRFKVLKQQERRLKGELVVIRWRDLDSRHQQLEQQLAEQRQALIKHQGHGESDQAKRMSAVEDLAQLKQDRDDSQKAFYQQAADISRLEQGLLHLRQQRQQLDKSLGELADSTAQAKEQQQALSAQCTEVSERLSVDSPRLEPLQARQRALDDGLHQAKVQAADSARTWQSQLQKHGKLEQQLTLAKQQQDSVGKQLSRLQQQQAHLDEQRRQFTGQREALAPGRWQQELDELEEKRRQLITEQQSLADQAQALDQQWQTTDDDLATARGELQQLEARLTSLRTLQEGLTPAEDPWLAQLPAAQAGWLWQKLDADPALTPALETVLGPFLNARCLETRPSARWLDGPETPAQRHYLLAPAPDGEDRGARLPYPMLADKVRSDYAVALLLEGVYLAADLAEAEKIAGQLHPGESVVTTEGAWLGPGFMVAGQTDEQQGVLRLEQQIAALQPQLTGKGRELNTLLEVKQALQQQLDAHRLLRGNNRTALGQVDEQQQHCRQQLLLQQQQLQQLDERLAEVANQTRQCREEQQQLDRDLALLDGQQQQLATQVKASHQLSQQLEAAQESALAAEQQSQQLLAQGQQQVHQLQMTLQKDQLALDGLQRQQQQLTLQLQQYHDRCESLERERQGLSVPETRQQDELKALLAARTAREASLTALENKIAELDSTLAGFDKSRQSHSSREQQLHKRIEKLTLDSQAMKIKAGAQLEQLEELQLTLTAVQAELPEHAQEKGWQARLLDTTGQINQLGAINLAAIDEYQSQLERQGYMSKQMADLEQALETLESAIRKIDRETRAKFKTTYDAINEGLETLFPKVFGGGSASLALTDDDLLQAGVTIMARPPGKKNSTIHLLSGGEKALTALSLVFAIFQLNPAPFCMLDEVDAPLDDANVERFCKLVGSMSEKVQFIFISHNKVSMEMATQLTGVTMQEPGVSRMVAVDIDEALAMADAS